MRSKFTYNTQAFENLEAHVAVQTKTFSLNIAVCSDASLRDHLMRELESTCSHIEVVAFWPYSQ